MDFQALSAAIHIPEQNLDTFTIDAKMPNFNNQDIY